MNDLETRLSSALSDTAHRQVPDSLTPPPFLVSAPASATKGRWLLPAVAAAVVVAVAIGVLVTADHVHRTGSTSPALSGVPLPREVQGTFHTDGNVSLTSDQLHLSVQIVMARLAAAGLADTTVRSEGANKLIIAGALTSSQLAQLPSLLAVNALQFRPLMTDSVEVSAQSGPISSSKVVDPWRGLGFTPPASAAGLAALTPARRQAVLAVLKGWNCRNVSVNKPDSAVVGCDTAGTTRYLMGAAIVDSGQVAHAAASAPGSSAGQLQWSIDIDLKPAAQQSWADYTTKHNLAVSPISVENQVADVLDGRVIVVSTIESTITGTTQITGSFDETSAKSLAAALGRAPLPVGFTQ